MRRILPDGSTDVAAGRHLLEPLTGVARKLTAMTSRRRFHLLLVITVVVLVQVELHSLVVVEAAGRLRIADVVVFADGLSTRRFIVHVV